MRQTLSLYIRDRKPDRHHNTLDMKHEPPIDILYRQFDVSRRGKTGSKSYRDKNVTEGKDCNGEEEGEKPAL